MTDIPSGRPYYVVVSERDSFQPDTGQPIVHEQGLLHASLDDIMERRSGLFDRYGRTWIARLEFIEEEKEVMTEHTSHPLADVIKAWADGRYVQFAHHDEPDQWLTWASFCEPPPVHRISRWRIKPRMISLNGHEFPAPETEAPAVGTEYFIASPDSTKMLASCSRWRDYISDRTWLRRGRVHLTREAAETHARAEILAVGGEV